MGFFNELIKGVAQGYSEAPSTQRKKLDWAYEELEETPYLHSSKYLYELVDEAETQDDLFSVFEHLERHQTHGIESYDKLFGTAAKKYKKLGKGD